MAALRYIADVKLSPIGGTVNTHLQYFVVLDAANLLGVFGRFRMLLDVKLVEVAGVEPASKKRDVEALHRLGPVGVTSTGVEPDDPDRGLVPWSRPPSGDVAVAYPVPPSGRPESPVGRFNESRYQEIPGTRPVTAYAAAGSA